MMAALRARTPGLLYLAVVLTGFYSLAYVPQELFAAPDAAATLAAVRANLPLLRAGIVAGAACYIAFLLLPLSLHRTLAPHGRAAAALMVAFVAVSVPISLSGLAHRLEILRIADGHAAFAAWSDAERASGIAIANLRYGAAQRLATIFWGLWLIPLGVLMLRARSLPRVLGGLLIAGGVGYPVAIVGAILSPAFEASPWPAWITRPATIGELGTCLWLLLRPPAVPAESPATSRA